MDRYTQQLNRILNFVENHGNASDKGAVAEVRAAHEARLAKPYAGYAGVHVWVGDRHCERIISRLELESAETHVLQHEFDRVVDMLAAAVNPKEPRE